MKYKVSVERDNLRFSAAHFATFSGQGEPLHGHNYQVTVEVEGELTEHAWVLDFADLKRLAAHLCAELDHRFLLPKDDPSLTLSSDGDAWSITFRDRSYVIPKTDVSALPLDNSTAERLAQWFCQRLAQALADRPNLSTISVGVEEAPGQTGYCTLELKPTHQ